MHDASPRNDRIEVKKITFGQVMIVLGITSGWLIVITGASNFFVGLGIAPIDTISYLLGLLILPFGVTYPISKFIAGKSRHSVFATWIIAALIVLVLMTIGLIRGS